MKRAQFIVKESDLSKREEFYNYIVNNYNYSVLLPKERMINNKFPFVVDMKKKEFWVCESVACCAAAAQNGVIITINEFKTNRK